MTVHDVMTRKVLTIGAHDAIARARTKMTDAGIHQLVVCGRRRQVVGVISSGDVRDAPDHGTVADFMCRRLLIVRPDTSLGGAAALMRAHAIGSLPVLRGDRLVGIVTVSDLLDVVDDADDAALDRIAPRAQAHRRTRSPRETALHPKHLVGHGT